MPNSNLVVDDVVRQMNDVTSRYDGQLPTHSRIRHHDPDRRFDGTVDVGEHARVFAKADAVDGVEEPWNEKVRDTDNGDDDRDAVFAASSRTTSSCVGH
ncbi:MAG: hypothetical protein VX424_04320 [Actinomycetota bacterium]|nr:hypothetical protein [Actinomycetota bacterium]